MLDQADTNIDVLAVQISRGTPTQGFVNAMRKSAMALAQMHLWDREEHTKRAELRKRLELIAHRAGELRRLLHNDEGLPDVHVRAALEEATGSSGWDEAVWAVCKHLPDFQQLAQTAAKRVETSDGRSQVVYNPDGLSTPVFCALVLRTAWSVARTEPLGQDNPKAHEFAEKLFVATGGPEPEQDGRIREWRQHFRGAAHATPEQNGPLAALFTIAEPEGDASRNKSPP